jgi:hypothetical protein
MPPIPGLSTRETALVAWVAVFLAFAFTKEDIRSSLGSLLKVIFTSAFLTGVIASAIAYAVATVLLLQKVGYWEGGMAKTAAYWFVGIALVAVSRTKHTDARYFRRFVLDNLALAAVVEFIVNVHTFPLPIELFFVPLSVLLVGVEVVAGGTPEFKAARKPVAWMLALLGGTALAFSVVYIASHFSAVTTTARVKDFLLPLLLSACLLPYLYALRMVTVWQTMLHMTKFGLRGDERLYKFARQSMMRACGFSLARAQVFEERFRGRLWAVTTESEVMQVVTEFKRTWRRDRGAAEPASREVKYGRRKLSGSA